MEKEFIIMVIMVTFIIGVSATEMFKHYLKMRQLGGGNDRQLEDKLTQLSLQNQVLIERVQVLERIVTDAEDNAAKTTLAQQIEALK
ncbi:hypothetical protein ACE02Y_08070 [Shewanella xiamenensis]|jgi:phage shock protein B|uniref:Phage shock protein B n=1 Tax=Shewanella xiamenensis TaxID=332186 RepID=A0A073KRB6_9GAMM|nr:MULTISPECIES: phage-shock protein [Shewanella]PZP37694.1 MAG: hypothetical protein DI594_02025 [Shewanella oneidensis]ASF16459.1 hypothetical protein CEQ32_16615 [Shewanella sp. FDAARGOS_354]KEK28927.1 hypothetical protein SXM_0102 [Shewanella xiamenensis]KPN78481.1 phage shock protein [Shewanella sp. Sh95]MCD8558558.1 phage shock protein B [Shewanella xiamenensis]